MTDKTNDHLDDIANLISGATEETTALLKELIYETRETRFAFLDIKNGWPDGHAHNVWWLANKAPAIWAANEDDRRVWIVDRDVVRRREVETLYVELRGMIGRRGGLVAVTSYHRADDLAIEAKREEVKAMEARHQHERDADNAKQAKREEARAVEQRREIAISLAGMLEQIEAIDPDEISEDGIDLADALVVALAAMDGGGDPFAAGVAEGLRP